MNIALFGAGKIAKKMALTVSKMKGVVPYAVAARDLSRAKEYAKTYGFKKAYGSYEEMLGDSEVELVYISTLTSDHYHHMKMCLEAGKHVLCEKPFTVNAAQAKEIAQLAKKKKLLAAEAMWTRYLPMRKVIDDVAASGIVGDLSSLTANLCYPLMDVERLQRAEMGGGALLDLGVYTINFALMVFGEDIKKIDSSAVLTPKKVDLTESITFTYKDNRVAILYSAMNARSDRKGIIFGDKGYIEVLNVNNCEGVNVYLWQDKDETSKLVKSYKAPKQITGFEYQVEACVKAIQSGAIECPEMPHSETIRVMEICDELRQNWGVKLKGDAAGKK
jgi:predicted dehydrogenase